MSEVAINRDRRFYGLVWRWHFYAGLFAAPFLLILSITGMIYLFNDELNDWIYPELRFASSTASALSVSRLIEAAQQVYPAGKVTRIDMPVEPARTAQVFVTTAGGEARRVFVDPPTAQVLGSYVYTKTLVGFADVMHGSLLIGDLGDAIVELAACWAFILVASGVYLWWPRYGSQEGGVWWPRWRVSGRMFWRDLHRVTGVYVGLLILFLIITGLPWATIWGGQWLTPFSNALGLGYPEGNRRLTSISMVGETIGEVPWTLQQAPMPASSPMHAGHADHDRPEPDTRRAALPPPIGVDAVVQILATQGMREAYRLSLPVGVEGVYMAYTYPDQPEGQRTLQIDQYSGEVLADIRFENYGAIAKAVEWGVALHMGNYFGRLNQIVMLVPCIGIIVMVFTGIIMWWCRRPSGRLGAPVASIMLKRRHKVAVVLLTGLVFPLAGISLIVVGTVDYLLLRFIPSWRRALN